MSDMIARGLSKSNLSKIENLSTVAGKNIEEFPIQIPEIDDTGRIKRAFGYGLSVQTRTLIVFPNTKRYKISSKLTMDVNYTAIAGQGFIIDASAITNGEALLVIGTKYPTYRNTMTAINGLELVGQSQATPGSPTPSEISAAKTNTTIGIKFDGVGSAGASHINLFNTNVYGFGTGVQYNNHSYIITMFNSDVYWCGTCIEMPSGLTDYGERITFVSCSFYNSVTLVKQSNADGSMKFVTCSFDYQSGRAFHVTAGRVTLIGGHIEAKHDDDYFWYVEGQGALLQFQGVEIVIPSEKGNTANYELGYVNSNTALGGLQMTNCFMSIPSYKKQFLIAGDGRVVVRDLITNQLDKKFSISKSLSRLRDGSFKDANALLDWTVEKGTPAIDTTTYYTGTGSLKLNSPDGTGVILNKEVACSPNELVTTSMYVKTENLVANSKMFYVQRRYLDAKGNVLYDATESINTDFDWKLYTFQDYRLAPPGTEKFQLRLSTGATVAACNMWVDEVYVTKN